MDADAAAIRSEEPTLRDFVQLLRRGLVLALAGGVIAAAAAFVFSRTLTPVFEAQATLVAATQDANRSGFGTTLITAPVLDANAYRIAVTSRTVLAAAITAADGRRAASIDIDELVKRSLTVRTEGTTTSPILRLQVRDTSPERARDLANGIAAAAIGWDEQRATRALQSIIDSLEAQIASIDAELGGEAPGADHVAGLGRARTDLALQLSSARALRSGAVGHLEVLEFAEASSVPVSPSPVRGAAVAGPMAMLFVYGLLLLRNALDSRIRGLDDLERIAQVPILAGFPRIAGSRRALPQEAAAYLRTAIDFGTVDAHPVVVLVTSTASGHGKSSVAAVLAESYARLNHRVLLLDADLRRPVLGSVYDVVANGSPTLRTALEDPFTVDPIAVALGGGFTLDLLPSAGEAPNPTELLRNGFSRLLYHHASRYDVIVMDSAPVLPVADTLTVAHHATGVVLAVSLPDAHQKQVTAALKMLRHAGANVLGVVATNLPKWPDARQGTGYGYGYGYGSEQARGKIVTTDTVVPKDAGADGMDRQAPVWRLAALLRARRRLTP